MSLNNQASSINSAELEAWLKSDIYRNNLEFWQRAWNMVKTAYTQMPDLSYLPTIPQGLTKQGAKRILDLGCGSGWLSIYLGRLGFFVTGVDISEHAIQLARQWAERETLNARFDVGDIADLPYPQGAFDAVVANSIFEHLTYDLARSALRQIKNTLVPGGSFVGCFDKVGSGPGDYFELSDKTHVYTDKGRQGMLLRNFSDQELKDLFSDWNLDSLETIKNGTRIIWAHN